MLRTKIVHTSRTFFENCRKNVENCFETMFPYGVQYNESEYDIQNNNLLYKNTKVPKYQNRGGYKTEILAKK